MQIVVSGIPVKIIKKNIKNMHLYVKPPNGNVEVSAPMTMTDESISLFVRTKLGWIRKQQSKFANQERQSVREYVSGESLYLFGKQYYLQVVHTSPKNSVTLEGEKAILNVRKNSTTEQRSAFVNEWYREQLKKQVSILLPKWEKLTGLYASSWQIKYMTTRWGTCNTATKKIWLNLQLAKKPIDCLEYVILHELAHIKVRNHGEDFVNIMNLYMPYWREIRKKLNDLKLDYMESDDYAND